MTTRPSIVITRPRLVIADDSDTLRRMLTLALRGEFDIIGVARDGAEAIAITCEKRPRLLLLDLAMPQIDGLQVIPAVRKCSPDTRIVVFSGFSEEALVALVLEQGAHAYIVKGSPLPTLVEELRREAAR
jgi:hypothetical protein